MNFLNFLVVLISYEDQVLHILLWSQIHLFVVNFSFQETKKYDITLTKSIQLRLSIYYDQSSDYTHKQLSRGVLQKRSSENRLQISKCDCKATLLKSYFGVAVNLLQQNTIFRTPFTKNTSEWLLLNTNPAVLQKWLTNLGSKWSPK